MQLKVTIQNLTNVYESLTDAHSFQKSIILNEIRMLQEYDSEWQESQQAPAWLGFIWECLLFMCMVLLMVAYVIHATTVPSTHYRNAPNHAMATMVAAEKKFKEWLDGRRNRKWINWRSKDGLAMNFDFEVPIGDKE